MEIDVVCYFHDPDKARLVHEVMVPAARRARHAGTTVRVERHWLHGPHVRIALAGPVATVEACAARALDEVRAGVRELPAHPSPTIAELLSASEASGRAELLPGPYEPIHPNATVRLETPNRDHLARLLGPDALRVRDELLAAALDPIDALAERGIGGPAARIWAALTAMTCHATTYRPGASGGAMSFLSHLEDHLHHHDPDGRVRAAFERLWRSQDELVAGRVAQLLAGEADDALAETCRAWSRAALTRADAAFANGALPLIPGEQYAAAADGFGDPNLARRWDGSSLSAFHREVATRFDPHAVAADFAPYRFATNVLYQVLLVGDIRPVERYAAAHLLSRAMARRSGVDWQRTTAAAS